MAKYKYHGAGPFPEEQDYMDANMCVIDSDLRKAVSEADYKELTTQRRGWYGVAIDIEYQEWTGHTCETQFTGETIADSMLDAYNKAKNDQGGIRGILPERAELTRVARIDKTDIDFLGMRFDEGFSVKAWEEFCQAEASKN